MGPKFGNFELVAFEPFNGNNKCSTCSNNGGYHLPHDEDGNKALTRQNDERFTITELEVWEVTIPPEFNRSEYLRKMREIAERNK